MILCSCAKSVRRLQSSHLTLFPHGKTANVQGSLAHLEVVVMKIRQHLSSSPLRSEIKKIIPSRLRLCPPAYFLVSAILMLSLAVASTALAGSATWNLNPTNGDWKTAANWTPATVPNGPRDEATFGISNTTDVSISGQAKVHTIAFSAGASAFSISTGVQLVMNGGGIINDSGIVQEFLIPGEVAGDGSIQFIKTARAGKGTVFTVKGAVSDFSIAYINFWDNSTAGNGTFILEGAAGGFASGTMNFSNSTTADNATIICEGSATATQGGVGFFDTASAANATIIANGSDDSDGLGGSAFFTGGATAADATLIASGTQSGLFAPGHIGFVDGATGGRARVKLFGTGSLNIDLHDEPGVTIGSLEGDGIVYLGSFNLMVGSNNLSTTFFGVIQDGGFILGHGSLTKVGTGELVLANANTYTGGTSIEGGTLLVANTTDGSATGRGTVAVNAGNLSGTGKIGGPAVTIGTATTAAILAPGSGVRLGKLRLSGSLTFNGLGNYEADLNSTLVRADQVAARGVVINSGAMATIRDLGTGTLTSGTVFAIINNTAATAIAGTFSNLPDGSTLVVGSNTYLVSYTGGSGNDLTLTVQ